MPTKILIAGGGLGGLSAALACARAGASVQVHEQAGGFTEVGAGIQLGPNATRTLQGWNLRDELRAICAAPTRLRILHAASGALLAQMPLGSEIEQRYGAPYLTVHRADLHRMLLGAVKQAGVNLHPASRVEDAVQDEHAIRARAVGIEVHADALVAADGIWSRIRSQVAGSAAPRPTGHVAFRALARQLDLPASCRTDEVTVWLGPHMHVVAYPVRCGGWLNMVALVEAGKRADATDWDQAGSSGELQAALGPISSDLQARVSAMSDWRVWTLHDREPVAGAHEMARGRIALLGDAAHPMLPYLAQGAGMAIEDAEALASNLAGKDSQSVPTALQRYASQRWKRSARVQRTARRNAVIFHATGSLRWARDAALSLLGHRLLDQPWLYR